MPGRNHFHLQVELLIRCLPAIARATDFALKGGTAINLFLRDMPRLSVDIDLTYLPVTGREAALADIHAQLAAMGKRSKSTVPGVNTRISGGEAPKLLLETMGARIKVEPSVTLRGSLLPPVQSELCPAAQDIYESFAEIQRLDTADLYAGKLCAALDRQHPRDLFDIMLLQAEGPIPDSIRRAFVAYLAAHRRPIAELLQPRRKPIDDLYANHFVGMTRAPVALADLEAARTQLFAWVGGALDGKERRFLLSIKQGEPEWSLLPFAGLEQWPAIQWKLHNIRKMSAARHRQAVDRLRKVLDL